MKNIHLHGKAFDDADFEGIIIGGQNQADTLRLVVPKVYGGELDLSPWSWALAYENESGTGDTVILKSKVSTVDSDNLWLDWKPSATATAEKGRLICQLYAYNSTGSKFTTKPFVVYVSEMLDPDPIVSPTPSYLEQALTLMAQYNEELDGVRTDTETYKNQAGQYASQALASANNAKASETNASTSEQNALASANKAKASETAAKTSETNAKASETAAKTSEANAQDSESMALQYKEVIETLKTQIEALESAAQTAKEAAETAQAQAEAARDELYKLIGGIPEDFTTVNYRLNDLEACHLENRDDGIYLIIKEDET